MNQRNTRFVTLSFNHDTSPEEAEALLDQFTDKLCAVAGIKPSRCYTEAYIFTKPAPHCHALLFTRKDRRSGRTIADVGGPPLAAITDWWKSVGCSCDTRKAFNLDGLAEYISSPSNMSLPGQQMKRIIKNTNILRS